MATETQLTGLVLAGGRSRRMGRDKSMLVFRGQLQVDRAVRIIRPACDKVYVSIRDDQDNPTTDATDVIIDRFGEIGPLGGLLSAFYHNRNSDVLMFSCAMPFVTVQMIKQLAEERDPNYLAVAPVNSEGQPEPLCAIYHASHKDHLLRAAKQGVRELSQIFDQHTVKRVTIDQPEQLDTINDSDEYFEAQKRIIGV